MKKLGLILFTCFPLLVFGQSKAMKNLSEEFPDGRVLMFYHSSLNMLNLDDNPEFTEMIRDIEKIKVLIIDKADQSFSPTTVSDLKNDLANYDFEELMVVTSKDYKIGVYILDDDGDIEGFFFLMDETDNFIAVDLVGRMPVKDVGMLIEKMKEANDF